MPRIPQRQDCDCHVPVSASEDIKLKVLEEKLMAELKMGKTFTTDITVGNLPSGSQINATDVVKDILYKILYAETPAKTVTSIAITTAPTKIVYTVGESFEPAGMVVTAYYSDETSEAITNYTYSPSGALATTDTKITVSYQNKTAEQAITVNPVVGISIYKGIVDAIPTTQAEIEALTLDTSMFKPELLESGYVYKNITTNNQFAVLAIAKSAELNCYEIKVSGFSMGFQTKEIGDYYLYHFEEPTSESSARYVYSFEEE